MTAARAPKSDVMAAVRVEVIPMPAAIGAEVRCGDVRNLTQSQFDEVYGALLDHLVILVRGQTLTDPELIEFGARFGTLDLAPLAKTGSKEFSRDPSPSWPQSFCPQHHTEPSYRDAQVW